MKILKEGLRVPPKTFIARCLKINDRGCGAYLEVSYEDCFVDEKGDHMGVGFFCEQCGITLYPYKDLWDSSCYQTLLKSNPDNILYCQTKENVPPWSHVKMPTFEEFCKAKGIEWGFR